MVQPPAARFLDSRTPPHIATLILVTSLGALSMNLFLPSLPNMTRYFETEYSVMQIAVAGYLAVNALLQLVIGPISDRFGRRPVLLACVAGFVLASAGCVLATSVEAFLACRLLQAVIVAGLVLPRAAIRDMVPQAQAASMIGWVTMGMSVAPMVAPALGGVLDDALGWKANFAALGLLGVVAFWLIWRDMGETATIRRVSFRSQIADYPGLLRSRRFWGYCATATFSSGAFFAYLGGAPFVGSRVYGLSPAMLGAYFGAPAIGYLIGNGLSGRYSARLGINPMILAGTLVTSAGMVAAIAVFLAGFGTAETFFGFMVFVGLGNGLVLPNATAGMLSVRPQLAGTASGLGGAITIAGGAALSALAATMLERGGGAIPLLELMAVTSLLSLAAIVYTIRRDRTLPAG
ncbi:multidrug resistance protein [Oceaniovalibus guishaninsula JLT2003]|uniref:Bcr/CflA family efflux transporter n=1 Tax=Oceaniovalibus guishaninsula JLT2003 TaxID=1231392 RepID=K2GS13_9RHOB|nr:multidrug effflux MFS transporter [Oceaniovalibus guishaninsula]EKE45426.1 multidrug resistance protein [Oceaniovalibus guishaninsula JLT2003]